MVRSSKLIERLSFDAHDIDLERVVFVGAEAVGSSPCRRCDESFALRFAVSNLRERCAPTRRSASPLGMQIAGVALTLD